MSALHAEDIPLPPSHTSPVQNEAILADVDVSQISNTDGQQSRAKGPGATAEIDQRAGDEEKLGSRETGLGPETEERGAISSTPPELQPPDTTVHEHHIIEGEFDVLDSGGGETSVAASSSQPASTLPNVVIRSQSPSSRTSTPPLVAGTSAPAAKKFSSVNVNKKFLSKTASPAAGSPSISAKLNSLSSSSPIPISNASSRLLSTKLTTIPSSKSSTSPNPPSGTPGSSGSSPWAKPAVPVPSGSVGGSSASPDTLHQPAPTRSRLLSTSTAMGSGQGKGGYMPQTAWKAVAADGIRGGPLGLSRDFPTAKEVAEGKRAAQVAAQAQAAHNQAILQGLNAFTQLDSNAHRWDDEDDDDDVIDFGDGIVYPPHEHPLLDSLPHDQPVSHTDRFVEDFDRSWPRKQPVRVDSGAPSSTNLPRRPGSDRVLFNASSNRLEPSLSRQPPPLVQPTKVLSKQELPSGHPAGSTQRPFDRPLPPHMQSERTDGSKMFPLPMTNNFVSSNATIDRSDPTATGPSSTAIRPAWSQHRDAERPLPPHLADRPELPPQSTAFATARSPTHALASIPPRRSFSQTVRSPVLAHPHPNEHTNGAVQAAVPQSSEEPGVDSQSAEMHTAAEKARLRRLAEEQEREAAAERARQKAKELEERLGLQDVSQKLAGETSTSAAPPPAMVPPGLNKHTITPKFTMAQRPQIVDAAGQAPSSVKPTVPATLLPARPDGENHGTDVSWRSRMTGGEDGKRQAEAKSNPRIARPTAESFFQSTSSGSRTLTSAINPATPSRHSLADQVATDSLEAPSGMLSASIVSSDKGMPRKENDFDGMLARIQAAMAQARAAPGTPSPAPPSGDESANLAPSKFSPCTIIPEQPSPVQHSASLPSGFDEFFEVTQPQLPRSPPPAWRTYNVKLPKATGPVRPIPNWRLQASDNARRHEPTNWPMSFDPPIENLSHVTLSRSDLFLAQPPPRRFSKHLDMGPVVSISPRKLEPFAKKPKRKASYDLAKTVDMIQPITSVESLLPSSSNTTALSLSLASSKDNNRWTVDQTSESVVSETARKPRFPVKTSVAAKAELNGLFPAEGVSIGVPDRGRSLVDMKPGVRFMVSSELEGDSLLDEVNKMSLETVGEASDDKVEGTRDPTDGKVSGTETPKTPPSLGGASSRGHTASPNGASTQWSKGSARSSSQNNHIKSMWEHAPAPSKDSASRPPESFSSTPQVPSSSTAHIAAPSTPLYPSLNAPSSADPPAPQPLSSGLKSYANSQPFSPTVSQSTFGTLRQSPSQYGFASPEQSVTSLPHQRSSANANGGYGMQPGVWSPSAFGTGYGYTKPAQNMGNLDHKAAIAFNAVPGKEGMYTSATGHDYRYAHGQSTASPFGHYQVQHHQSPPPQAVYGQSPYIGRQNLASPPAAAYGYGYGAPGTHATSAGNRTRFDSGSGLSDFASTNPNSIQARSYYGDVTQPQAAYGYSGHGVVGQAGRGVGAGAAAGTPQNSGQRKMW